MTSDFLGKWIKKKRKEKGFSIKEFHRKFQDHIKDLGLSKLKRSYAWFSGLERYGTSKNDLTLISSILDFLGYKLVIVRNGVKVKEDLSKEEVIELLEVCVDQEKEVEQVKEKLLETKIGNKNW